MINDIKNDKSLSISTQVGAIRAPEKKSPKSNNSSDAAKVDVSAIAKAAASDPNFSEVVDVLNAAANLSEQALNSLGSLSQKDGGKAINTDAIRADLQKTVDSLRQQIDTADIVRENIASASSRLEDLDAAQQQAQSVGLRIQANASAAIDAHKGLDPDRVAELLAD